MSVNSRVMLPDFTDLHIVVIGDVMIDRYISGAIRRISPEAPVPVVEMSSVENRLGGAANVALNLSALGAQVTILSITGQDEDAITLKSMFDYMGNIACHFTSIAHRKTTVKTRVMAANQHVLRIDSEDTTDISDDKEMVFLASFRQTMETKKVDGIILQDYNKGLLTPSVISYIMDYSKIHDIATFVDPKEKNFFAYKGCTMFKPNKKEILKAFQTNTLDFEKIDSLLRDKIHHQITFITLGSKGIYTNDGEKSKVYETSPRVISDVCGAGDTVISVATLCYLKSMSMDEIGQISNIAGGQVCEQPGVVSINRQTLTKELENLGN